MYVLLTLFPPLCPQPPPGDLALNATFEVDLDERLSVASDASSGQRRLISVGDVQHVAKMQEESECFGANCAFLTDESAGQRG